MSDRCEKFQLALFVLAGSFVYCLVFLIYMTGSYKPEQIKECCNANFSHCCVGTMKQYWLVAGVPLAHIVVGLLVLIQARAHPHRARFTAAADERWIAVQRGPHAHTVGFDRIICR